MTFISDNRGVSIAVTHVLAIGISAILVAGLVMGATSMLDAEQDRSVDTSLETVGERLAGEIEQVDRTHATVTTSHPSVVSGTRYTVAVEKVNNPDDCGPLIEADDVYCVHLDPDNTDRDTYVPFKVDDDVSVEADEVRGGPIQIKYEQVGGNDEIQLSEAES